MEHHSAFSVHTGQEGVSLHLGLKILEENSLMPQDQMNTADELSSFTGVTSTQTRQNPPVILQTPPSAVEQIYRWQTEEGSLKWKQSHSQSCYTQHRGKFKRQLLCDLTAQLFEAREEMAAPPPEESCSPDQEQQGTGSLDMTDLHTPHRGHRRKRSLCSAPTDSNSAKQIHDMNPKLHHNISECSSATPSALLYSTT